jgi:linoleoyl-CoA desaturase
MIEQQQQTPSAAATRQSRTFKIHFAAKNKETDKFYATLRKRVDQHFKDLGVTRYANDRMLIKSAVLLSAYILPFLFLLFFQPGLFLSLFIWSVMGLSLAGVGMSVMHDANHGAYSAKSSVNLMMAQTLTLLGGATFTWKLQHNVLHHTYTNITHMDDDIEDKLIMRFSPHTAVRWYHRYQFLYVFPLYSILTIYWVLLKDYVQYFKYKKQGLFRADDPANRYLLLRILFSKIIYFFFFLILPLAILKMPAAAYIIGFLVMHGVGGLVLGTIFQLAHTVEGTSHPLPDTTGTIENNWAIHQMNTTANFAHGNKWLSWYIGGLNFQVEHHLFPNICHVHYPAISGIVKTTAEEFGIPYLENKTFGSALSSHLAFLRTLGPREIFSETLA